MNKKLIAFVVLVLLLLCTTAVAVMFGGSALKLPEILRALLHPHASDTVAMIIWHIRLPRILMGMLVGMGLAASGCVFQGMLRNPLADPYTLGISGGAAFGAAIGIISGLAALHLLFLPLSAFAGTLLCVALVYAISARSRFSLSTLILSGVILGFLFSSMVLLMIALSNAQKIQATILWLMGDLSSAETRLLPLLLAFVVPGIVFLSLFGRELNLLTLGDEKARQLGVDARSVKKWLFIVASLVTGACVSVSGIIGFVGLMMPHIMRRLTGADHQSLIPLSALAGAVFLTLCDTFARTVIAPVELPVGVITGLLGGVFFLLFLFKSGGDRVW